MTRIYALIDPESLEIRYIGKTKTDVGRRFLRHLREKRQGTYKRNWIAALERRGLRPLLDLIDVVSEDEGAETEQYWIAYYRFTGCRLLNMTDGGEGRLGQIASVETREKLRLAATGRSFSSETKKKIADALRGKSNPHLGKIPSEESRKKMSDSHKGRVTKPPSAATRKKISEAFKGKALSVEHRRKLSDAHKGKKPLEETRRKMSIAHKNRRLP